MSAVSATAMVPTANGSRYLQQLCKHWQHKMPVEFTAKRGTVTFPRDARGADWPGEGLVTMTAHPDTWTAASMRVPKGNWMD